MIDNKLFKLWTWHFYFTHNVGIQFSVTTSQKVVLVIFEKKKLSFVILYRSVHIYTGNRNVDKSPREITVYPKIF